MHDLRITAGSGQRRPERLSDSWRTIAIRVMKDAARPRSEWGSPSGAGQYRGQTRADLVAIANVQPYARHYRAFGQTYHVLRQLESVALKGKPLTSPSTLVLAMFAAELESLLLTAGHDLDAVQLP